MRRPERVGEQLRAEIVQIVGYELEDPRVSMVTVTDVRMSENLREARVYFTVAGTDEEARAAHKALNHAAPYVRRQLAVELSLRHAPQIFFIRDTVEEKATRVDALLQEIKHDSPPPQEATVGEEGKDVSDE
jgi:ribosome-binding factor A